MSCVAFVTPPLLAWVLATLHHWLHMLMCRLSWEKRHILKDDIAQGVLREEKSGRILM